ncbi:MAG: response regulator [Pseudomonadales bacterium]|nr:response regulator [Pseudomonadales bacterium]
MNTPRDFRVLFVKRCVIVLLMSTLFLLVFTYVEDGRKTAAQLELSHLKISTLIATLDRNLSYLSDDLDSLLEADPLNRFLNEPSLSNKTSLEEHFKLFAETSRRYDQIRILSSEGMETLRLNYRPPIAHVVPPAKLQDKSDRYYFKEVMALPSDQAYVSQFDLNVENGEIERPLKPMIRLSQKLYNTNHQVVGVIVLNFLAGPIIKSLELLNNERPNNLALLDGDGYWIYDSDSLLNWSNQLGNQERFSQIYPNDWERISLNGLNEFQNGNHIYIHQALTFPKSNTKERQRTLHLIYSLKPHSWLTNPELSEILALMVYVTGVVFVCWFWTQSTHRNLLNTATIKYQKARLEKIINTSLDGIIVISQSGEIMEYNPASERIFGYSAKEAIGKNVNIIIPSPHSTAHDEYLQTYLNERSSRVLYNKRELTGKHKNGTLVEIELAVSEMEQEGKYYFVGSITDITERKSIEQERLNYQNNLEAAIKERTADLRVSNERLNLAIETGNLGIWDFQFDDNRLVWNEQMFNIYGLKKDKFQNRFEDWQRLIHPNDATNFEQDLKSAVKSGKVLDTTFKIIQPCGTIKVIKALANTIKVGPHNSKRLIGINRDITKEALTRQSLEKTRDSALLAAKAKSEFLANMSHEIRTPMNAILGLTYLLNKEDMPQPVRETASKIQRAGESLQGILNDILDFSKIEAGKIVLSKENFAFTNILDNVSIIMSANAASKQIELVIQPNFNTHERLIGDRLRIEQVLINLVSNAIKFTDNGHVILRITQPHTTETDVTLQFMVEDTGIGMDEETTGRIFGAFEQADASTTRKFGGTGLGLAICTQLLKLMDSTLSVTSEKDQGTKICFELKLPRAGTDKDALQNLKELDVLIADDHDVALDALKETARSLGWNPICASGGNEALDIALANHNVGKPLDLLLLDWQMPDLDGLAVASMVKSKDLNHPAPIIIMVTSFSKEDVLASPKAKYVDSVIEKPVTASRLYDALIEIEHKKNPIDIAPKHSTGKALKDINLLVVDDNDFNRDVAKRVFEAEGATVKTCCDGSDALHRLQTGKENFDLVLMDIQMPVMDGYEATQAIRKDKLLRHLPVIALTAGAFENHKQAAYIAGMNAFIPKPFDVPKAIETIQRVLKGENAKDVDSLIVEKPLLFNEEKALKLWGDKDTLANYLNKFVSDYLSVITELNSMPYDEAKKLTHKFKGAAASLALEQLGQQLGDLEKAFKNTESTQTRLDDLEKLLNQTFNIINKYIDSVFESKKNKEPDDDLLRHPDREQLNRKDLADLFRDTLSALNSDNPDQIDPLLSQLKLYIPKEDLRDLIQSVEDFNFRKAELNLEVLAKKLSLEVR